MSKMEFGFGKATHVAHVGLRFALAAVALLAVPSSAAAQRRTVKDDAGHPFQPKAQANRLWAELDYWRTTYGADVNSVSFTPALQLELSPNLYLDVELPFAYGSREADNVGPFFIDRWSAGTFGNATVGIHATGWVNPGFAYHLGAGLAIPTMLASDPKYEARYAGALAVAGRGGLDAHRFFSEHLGVRGGGGVEIELTELLLLRSSLYVASYVPFHDDFELYADQVNELEARLPSGIGGGLRLQEVLMVTERDNLQTALEPFVSYEPGKKQLFGRVGLMLPLDEGIGPFWKAGNPITLRMSGGYSW